MIAVMAMERVQLENKEVILVGTAHISRESVRLAQETIRQERPDAVGIELDEQRLHQLQNDSKWQTTNISNVLKEGKTYLLLLNIFLSNLQRKMGESLDVKPGEEMLQSAKTANELGIPVVLLDRNIQVTMQRAFALVPLLEKIKIIAYLFGGIFSKSEPLTHEKIEELTQSDTVTNLIRELAEKAPTVKKVLVDERDAFIAEKIRSLSARKIVCVIGAGHVQGIKHLLENPATRIDLRALSAIPKKNNAILSLFKWVIPIAFIALLVIFASGKGLEYSATALMYWILITGGFSALGALVAKSHPFTIGTAFIAAPLTTLHPFLASGWFAAGMEAKYHSPEVADFQQLHSLNSYRDFEQNKVTHLLLVASYTNLGSIIGTIVAFPYLISLLG